jgi:hypothetical protein
MNVSTRARTVALLLVLAATALSALGTPLPRKNATGCSLEEDSRPSSDGCTGRGFGCYDCGYSDPYGIIQCFENIDGTIAYCKPAPYYN